MFIDCSKCLKEQYHRRRKVLNIGEQGGVGGGAQGQNIGGGCYGGGGGCIFFAGRNLIDAPAPNQFRIITFLTLITDNITKLRIELTVYFWNYHQV